MLLLALAWASPTFPPTIVAELGAPCEPACTVCHDTAAGGSGTVTQPFGAELLARGLSGGDTDALAAALAELEAEGVDTDGDGTPDVEGLALGFDPNTGVNLCGLVTAEYGCFHGYGAALLLLPLISLRTSTGSRAPRRGTTPYTGRSGR